MAYVDDVAAYILRECGSMSTMKLQKLVYYCQAWHLAWDEVPLFPEPIEAWANGPVVYKLFQEHRGRFSVDRWPSGDPSRLTGSERDTIDTVIEDYGKLTGRQLSHLTHNEEPWRQARGDLAPTAWSRNVISTEALRDYFMAVDASEDAVPVEDVPWDEWEST